MFKALEINRLSITSFTSLYQKAVGENSLLSSFISGHLVIEFLLMKLVVIYKPSLSSLVESMNHASLIKLTHGLSLIRDDERDVLNKINKMRNNLAHELTFEPSINDLKLLFTEAARAFNDLTDGIEQGLGELNSISSLEDLESWVIPELMIQISYDLHEKYQELGGDIDSF